jgi:hypothetical protein
VKFAEQMPAQLRRGHAIGAEWRGDRRSAIVNQRKAINRATQHRWLPMPAPSRDMNFHWHWRDPSNHALGGDHRCHHWADPRRNNYRFYLEPGATKARRMTRAELRRTVWTDAEVARWRRTSDPHSAYPERYAVLAKVGHDNDVYVIPEWKNADCGTSQAAASFVQAARLAAHPPWSMALLNLPGARAKSEQIQHAGGSFALIFGSLTARARKPKDWNQWSPKPTRIWSSSRRLRAWL